MSCRIIKKTVTYIPFTPGQSPVGDAKGRPAEEEEEAEEAFSRSNACVIRYDDVTDVIIATHRCVLRNVSFSIVTPITYLSKWSRQ